MTNPNQTVSGWLLAGGLSQRMGGLDKGLQPYQGQAMALWVWQALSPQVSWLGASANRNQADYATLLRTDQIKPDDSDLPPNSGPLAGIITGLRHAPGDWLMVCPCDSPRIPPNLVERLMNTALQHDLDVVTPCTHENLEERPHWVCSLIHKRVYPKLLGQFVNGERKVGRFIQSMNWAAVSFDEPSAFANMNTLESLHGRI
jgi:molybdenum cofactor guanylyltransferase